MSKDESNDWDFDDPEMTDQTGAFKGPEDTNLFANLRLGISDGLKGKFKKAPMSNNTDADEVREILEDGVGPDHKPKAYIDPGYAILMSTGLVLINIIIYTSLNGPVCKLFTGVGPNCEHAKYVEYLKTGDKSLLSIW